MRGTQEPKKTAERESRSLIEAAGFSYFPIALMARLPFAMMVVGVLTLVVSGRGSLALGGLNSAMVGVGGAIFGPLIGAAADRYGQRPVVLAAGLANSVALLVMSWIVYSPVPDTAMLAVGFAIGATAPQVSPMSRSRLVVITLRKIPTARRIRVLNGMMAYESAADEIVFVFGPFVVGLLATTMNAAMPVVIGAILNLVFVSAFALHRSSTVANDGGSARDRVQGPASELLRPALLVVVLGVTGVGVFFGSMLTSLTAFMEVRGHPEAAGLVYGAMGVGSAALALAVAFMPARFTPRARWLVFAAVLFAGTLALELVDSVAGMVVVLLVIGVGIGPTLVTQYSFGADRSPQGRSATVMTILGSGVIVGQSAASAFTGSLAQAAGPSAALAVPSAAAGIVVVAGLANWVLTGRAAATKG
ncbi:MFS transporter [Sinomonas sp. ASV322]|uniref:MFS transporter n=1 Tax=Sinomonas sp. ASV322 TaxID=3041920 RepID=UPI0027DB9546|nr:MFS transporter [Sinomonas sp. ASV322]MDQ4504627.1 MFS transporter [Sinomonas sp. ASV322]